MEEAVAEWAGLSGPWSEAFELAWESFVAGSPPVGAVVVAKDGSVVSRGRSRRAEPTAPLGQLAGSRLSHAEVNALAQLPVDADRGHELFVTLEPCFLCVAAAAMSHIAVVHFAGGDPIWRFLARLPDAHSVLRDRWFVLDGPVTGPMGVWASLLPLVERIGRDPDGARMDAFEAEDSELVSFAKELVATGRIDQLRDLSLDDAIGDVWPDLGTLAASR